MLEEINRPTNQPSAHPVCFLNNLAKQLADIGTASVTKIKISSGTPNQTCKVLPGSISIFY
jgi:hypothetical protein